MEGDFTGTCSGIDGISAGEQLRTSLWSAGSFVEACFLM